MSECPFKYRFKSADVVKCTLIIDLHCIGEEKCRAKPLIDYVVLKNV